MQKLIKNEWRREGSIERAVILRRDVQPEGLDVERIRFSGGTVTLSNQGHVLSVIRGRARFDGMSLSAGMHAYVPGEVTLEGEAGTELIHVAGRGRGERLIVRDEQFLCACAIGAHSLRWILTPQYLSRRIFLHHDRALASKSGHPVSWFHTTMFDVSGLPVNEDGDPVFKMSYNSRTEFNVCYDVAGKARLRLARHPYSDKRWDPWLALDSESTYHLNEAAGGPEEERYSESGEERTLRNRHEVHIDGRHVSLFCAFDPAPTGIERHRPGEYSDYEPISRILGTPEYKIHQQEIGRFDEMVDQLSLAKAKGELDRHQGTALYQRYVEGRSAQCAIEASLARTLAARAGTIQRWMQLP